MTTNGQLLRSAKTIAVVGLSNRRSRPSYGVSEYMQSLGLQARQAIGDLAERGAHAVQLLAAFDRRELQPVSGDFADVNGAHL